MPNHKTANDMPMTKTKRSVAGSGWSGRDGSFDMPQD